MTVKSISNRPAGSVVPAPKVDADKLLAEASTAGKITVSAGFRAPGVRQVLRDVADAPPPPSTPVSKQDVAALTDSLDALGDASNIMGFMYALQKMLDKEARADRALKRKDKAIEREMKADKLDLENEKILQQQAEADQRYDTSIDAANMELAMGIADAAMQVGALWCNIKAGLASTPEAERGMWQTAANLTNAGNTVQKTVLARLNAHNRAYNDYQKAQGLRSDGTQLQINEQQKRIDRQTNAAEEASDGAQAKKDMRQRGLDNLQKMLDIIRSIQPQI